MAGEEPDFGRPLPGAHYEHIQIQGGKTHLGHSFHTSNIHVENRVIINSKVASQPDYSGQYSYSSFGPVSTYVSRPNLHERIREQLHDRLAETARNAKILVVWGLGGAGKSQLVLNYLQEYRDDYSATFWIAAGQKESLERDFLQIYRLLYRLSERPGETTVKIDDAVSAVKKRFDEQNGRWLLVLDSADIIDNGDDPGYIDLRHYLPTAPSVDIIITTRSSKAKAMTQLPSVEVGSMELSEAAQLFSACSKCDIAKKEAKIETLVQELGNLALAVTLAGYYVSEMHLELDGYLEEYRQRRRELLHERPEHLIQEYSESVLTTWESSFRAIQHRNLEASRLLTLLAFVHNDDILLDLFKLATNTVPENETNDEESNNNQSLWQLVISPQKAVDMSTIRQAFRVLESFSLIQWKEDQRGYVMHKLVHAWAYERLNQDKQQIFSVAMLELLSSTITNWPAFPQYKIRLIPHLMANFSIVSRMHQIMGIDEEYVLDFLGIISGFLDATGRWADVCAVETFQFKQKKRLYGCDHPSTISAMNNLANTLGDQGQLEETARMKKEVLEKIQRILGEDHPSTISVMNNLANTLGDQGQLEEAARMMKEVLEKMQHILGEDHPSTISAMNNLASTLGDQGQLEEAARMMKEVLEKMQRILGEDHPSTISAINNLASTLRDQGQLEEAARMKKEVLEKRQRILGEDHPSTISAINNLANTLGDQGQLEEAVNMMSRVVRDMNRILGEEHPKTRVAKANLARFTNMEA